MTEQELNNIPALKKERRVSVSSVARRFMSPVGKGKGVTDRTIRRQADVVPVSFPSLAWGNTDGKFMLSLKNKTDYPKISLIEESFFFGTPTPQVVDDPSERFVGREVTISSEKWGLANSSGFDFNGFHIIHMQEAVIESLTETTETDRYVYTTDPAVHLNSVSFLLTAAEYEKIKSVKPKVLAVCGVLNRIHNPIQRLPEVIQLHRFL